MATTALVGRGSSTSRPVSTGQDVIRRPNGAPPAVRGEVAAAGQVGGLQGHRVHGADPRRGRQVQAHRQRPAGLGDQRDRVAEQVPAGREHAPRPPVEGHRAQRAGDHGGRPRPPGPPTPRRSPAARRRRRWTAGSAPAIRSAAGARSAAGSAPPSAGSRGAACGGGQPAGAPAGSAVAERAAPSSMAIRAGAGDGRPGDLPRHARRIAVSTREQAGEQHRDGQRRAGRRGRPAPAATAPSPRPRAGPHTPATALPRSSTPRRRRRRDLHGRRRPGRRNTRDPNRLSSAVTRRRHEPADPFVHRPIGW